MKKNIENKSNKSIEKGGFLYLNTKKKNQLIIASLSMLMVAIICVTGIILYHTQKSIFAVMAALAALPAAKMLVGYLVIMPYHSVGAEVKENLEAVKGNPDCCRILYDVILSSTDKSMCAGVVFIKKGKIYGYTDYYKNNKKTKITLTDVEKHIKFIIDSNCNYTAIKMYDDLQKFTSAVKSESTSEENMTSDDLMKMKNMNERIENQLKIYMF